MVKINIEPSGETIVAMPGQSLLNSLLYEDQPIHTICGGRAQCGCCRIKISSDGKGVSPINDREKRRLNKDDVEKGWRLACQTYLLRDVSIYIPAADELESYCSKQALLRTTR